MVVATVLDPAVAGQVLLSGLVGGFVAAVVMTVFMMTLGDDSPPPSALFWSKDLGDREPQASMTRGMVLHLLYGTVAGAVFALLVPVVGLIVESVGSAVLWGLVWAVVLFVVGAVLWMGLVLGMEPELNQSGMMLFFHLAYGAVFGAWIGVGPLG